MKPKNELKNTYKGERLSIGVSVETYENLCQIASEEERSISATARKLIGEALIARQQAKNFKGVV